MNSSLPTDPSEDRTLILPARGNTVAAEDLKVRLVLAADLDDEIRIDASQVESVGQCVLQLLVAARAEAEQKSLEFEITNPSPAFVERVAGCGLAETLGLETGKDHP
ncbi:STAS domain-containing protein [Novosphingobium sp. M1R2S20]|uniref:STAS domain-containing protein n=1 Tax=Novosphingobium rhizovicinum TaxID=3228928 RepID=A0ABV3R8X4_9SPHN